MCEPDRSLPQATTPTITSTHASTHGINRRIIHLLPKRARESLPDRSRGEGGRVPGAALLLAAHLDEGPPVVGHVGRWAGAGLRGDEPDLADVSDVAVGEGE